MSDSKGFDRRAFLKGASMTAIAGAVGAGNTAAQAAPAGKADMGAYDFDQTVSRVGSNCYKFCAQIEKFGREYMQLGMGVADMDFHVAPVITEALRERATHENWGYLGNTNGLREAIVEWNKVRYDVDVDPDTVTMCSGVHNGLISTLNAVSRPGSKTIMNTPTYNGFYTDLRLSRTLVNDSEMYVDDDGKYQVDWDDFEARLTPDTRAFLLCNPQNPTGNVWTEEELLRFGELCLKNDVVVLADEIHCDFVMAGQKYTPFASLPDKDIVNNSLTYKSASKTFSIAGLKHAYFYSTNKTLLDRVRWMHRADLNTLGVFGTEAALRRGGEWFDALLPYIDENQSFVADYVNERIPGVKVHKAEGTYLAWLDVAEPVEGLECAKRAEKEGLQTAEHYFEKWLVENAGVQLNPGSNYGTGGAGRMRMNLGTSKANIEKALNRIESAVKSA
ncbi:MAG: aminotransferase class I/II-fold pyridoxal phosphate-dependent enzyme [Pseudomonadota bacterium]